MGCWEETCGITNTPIFEGDEVVLVVLSNEIGDEKISLGLGSWDDLRHVTAVAKGPYDHYGWVKGFREAKRGEALEETDGGTVYETSEWMRKAMFHRQAWDAVLEKNPPDDEMVRRCGSWMRVGKIVEEYANEYPDPPVDPKLLAEFCCVRLFCRGLHRNILGSRDCSTQESPGERRKEHLWMLDLCKKMVMKKRKRR